MTKIFQRFCCALFDFCHISRMANQFESLSAESSESRLTQMTLEETEEFHAWLDEVNAMVPEPTRLN